MYSSVEERMLKIRRNSLLHKKSKKSTQLADTLGRTCGLPGVRGPSGEKHHSSKTIGPLYCFMFKLKIFHVKCTIQVTRKAFTAVMRAAQ
jgi:hypothetical protein